MLLSVPVHFMKTSSEKLAENMGNYECKISCSAHFTIFFYNGKKVYYYFKYRNIEVSYLSHPLRLGVEINTQFFSYIHV